MTSFNPNPWQRPQQPQQRHQRPIIIQQSPAPRGHRMRTGWIVTFVVGLGLVIMMLTTGIPFGWGAVMSFAGIHNRGSSTALFVLGLGLVGLTILAKALRGRR